jgi:tetratricopeptide (TPR) repeat protein
MNAGGLMVQWFHLYEMSDDLFKMVVRTFQTSFSNVSIWQPQGNDVIMIGSDRTLTVDFDKIKAAIAMQHVKEDLQRIDIPDAATLLSLEMLSPKSVLQYVSVGDLNTEDNPRLEYNAPKAFFLGSGVSDLSRLDERLRCDSVSNELKRRLDNRLLTDEELYHIGFFHTKQQSFNLRFGYAILRTLLTRHQKDVLLLERLAQTAETINLPDDAISYYKNLAELEPNSPTYLEKYAWLKYTTERNYTTLLTPVSTKESEGLLNTCITITVDTVDRYHFKLAEMYYGTQRYAKAAEHYARTFQIRTKYEGDASIHDDVLYLQLARCLNKLGKNDRALAYALSAVNVNPKNEEAKDLFYELWTKGMNSVKSK